MLPAAHSVSAAPQPRRIDDVIHPNSLVGLGQLPHPRRQMPPGFVRAFSNVMRPPFPVDVVEVPFRHDHELVEAFHLLTLDKPSHVRRQVGTAYRSQPCLPQPVERWQWLLTQSERDAETTESFGRDRPGKADSAGARLSRATCRDGNCETRRMLEVVARSDRQSAKQCGRDE